MAQLGAECELRGYHSHGISQPDADETSGTTTIRLANGAAAPAFDLVWEKLRDKALVVQARPGGDPVPTIPDLRCFLAAATKATRSKRRAVQHKRAYLVVPNGRPWSGDLWLTPKLCLGAPSKQGSYASDPHIIVVDAMVEGIGWRGVTDSFQRLLRELLIFLDVVIGTHAIEQRDRRAWTYEIEDNHYKNIELRFSGYYELEPPQMPIAGARPAMPIQTVMRPGVVGAPNLAHTDTQVAPQDAASLWQQLQSLKPELQRQFLEAGNAYWNAQSFWWHQRTAFASFLVVSCEALKPARRKFDNANIYDVINSLRDQTAAEQLRTLAQHPQSIRSDHFHRGKLADNELAPRFGSNYFDDPTFDELLRTLNINARICLIQWLRLGGNYTLRWLTRARPTWQTRLRKAIAALRGVR